MSSLIALKNIPTTTARRMESTARREHASRAAALEASSYQIVSAPGCHGRPPNDPPVIGWVCTREAAEAISSQETRMPGGTSHRRIAFREVT